MIYAAFSVRIIFRKRYKQIIRSLGGDEARWWRIALHIFRHTIIYILHVFFSASWIYLRLRFTTVLEQNTHYRDGRETDKFESNIALIMWYNELICVCIIYIKYIRTYIGIGTRVLNCENATWMRQTKIFIICAAISRKWIRLCEIAKLHLSRAMITILRLTTAENIISNIKILLKHANTTHI